uniref:Uncharacterized protein n=1 Tax=Anguilla anguilla TaxID=7936 RepID=A0A0E9R9N0_ANGAN
MTTRWKPTLVTACANVGKTGPTPVLISALSGLERLTLLCVQQT